MARLPPLPERLRYLQPFRKKFSNRPPEELDEESGVGPLLVLLHKRIKGHPTVEAEALLKEDGAALQMWLSSPDGQSDCLHFASAFLCMIAPAELVALILEEAKRSAKAQAVVGMELPVGARLRRDKLITFNKLLIALDAVSEEAAANFADVMGLRGTGDSDTEVQVLSVRYGQVSGNKYVRRGQSWRGPFKEVSYVLAVPGGHVLASASPLGKNADDANWDESALEAVLHTLRVIHKDGVT